MQQIKALRILSIAIIIVGFVISLLLLTKTNRQDFIVNTSVIVTLMAALWSLAGVLLFYQAIRLQQIEINTQVEEFRKQTEILHYDAVQKFIDNRVSVIKEAIKELNLKINGESFQGAKAVIAFNSIYCQDNQEQFVATIQWSINDFNDFIKEKLKSDKLKSEIITTLQFYIENIEELTTLFSVICENSEAMVEFLEVSNLDTKSKLLHQKMIRRLMGSSTIHFIVYFTNIIYLFKESYGGYSSEPKDLLKYKNSIKYALPKLSKDGYGNGYFVRTNIDNYKKLPKFLWAWGTDKEAVGFFNRTTPHNRVGGPPTIR